MNHFVKNYGLEVVNNEIMKIKPQKDGSDGFFAVVFKKRSWADFKYYEIFLVNIS